jgi:DNA repair protein RecO (recombination protein O)
MAIRGQDILAIDNDEWHVDSLKAAKKISRIAMRPIVGDKPIKSRELFKSNTTKN